MNWIKFASVNLGLLLLFAFDPYPRWLLPQGLFQIIFLFTTTIATIQLKYNFRRGLIFNKSKIKVFIAAVIYLIYFTTPVIHEIRWGQFFYFIIFLQIIYYNDVFFYNAYKILKKTFVYISIFSLIYWVLNAMDISLPYYKFITSERQSLLDNYRIYGLALSLYHGNIPIGGGLERICGVFAEPGHFGIYLGLILLVEKFRFYTRSNIILLVTGFLTFSTAFYGIFALGVIYRVIEVRKIPDDIKKNTCILLLVSVIFLFSSNKFSDTIYGRVVDKRKTEVNSVWDLVENRIPDSYVYEFIQFSKTKDNITGKGYYNENMIITNWRGLIYRFGIVGAVVMFILILSILIGTDYKYAFLGGAILLLIIAHRVYIMYSPTIYIMLLVAVSANRVKNYYMQYLRMR